jgi:hypothetical protein
MLLTLQWFWKVCYTRGNLNVVCLHVPYRLKGFLLEEEERDRRIVQSMQLRRHGSLPDEHYLRRARIW